MLNTKGRIRKKGKDAKELGLLGMLNTKGRIPS